MSSVIGKLSGLLRKNSLLISIIAVPILSLLNALLINVVCWRYIRLLQSGGQQVGEMYERYRFLFGVVVLSEFIFFAGMVAVIFYISKKVIFNLRRRFDRANERLSTSEEKYQAILAAIDDGIVVFRDDKILWTNDRFCTLVGREKQEVVGSDLYRFIAPEFRSIVKTRYRLRKEGKPVPRSYEIEGIHSSGRRLPVEVVPTFVHFEGDLANQTIVRDLTETNMIKSQLLYSNRMVAIGEVAGNLAHQLNNPLVGVIDIAKLMANKEELPDEYRTYINTILEAGQDSARIVRNLLKYSSEDKFIIQPTDIQKIVDEVLSISEHSISYENITVIRDFKLPLPLVDCNEVQIGQVFLNIIQNARQAMTNGGTLTITVRHLKSDDAVEIRFKDTGPGIDPYNIGRVFEPCFSTKQHGTGLGLSIGSKIVKKHRGTLEAESREGAGATFIIRLPVKSAELETHGTTG